MNLLNRVRSYLCFALAALLVVSPAGVYGDTNNGAAQTPILGWSTWSSLRWGANETNFKAEAQAMVNTGLASYGFQYVNMDDGWYLNPSTTVDSYGRWTWDPSLYPDGIPAVASYVHGLGLKFGIYLTPGVPVAAYNANTPIQGTSYTAQQIVASPPAYAMNYRYTDVMYQINYSAPGAQPFIQSWANLLASWGVDYIKLDAIGAGADLQPTADVEAWGTALNEVYTSTGKSIALELSNDLSLSQGPTWQQYANGWRTYFDIECYDSCPNSGENYLTDWNNVVQRFSNTPSWQTYSGWGGWADLDSLEIGDGSGVLQPDGTTSLPDGLTSDERLTMETLWAMNESPLILGSDLRTMDSADLQQLLHWHIIRIDQNGVPGAPVTFTAGDQTDPEVWRQRQPDGSYAVALFNLESTSEPVSFSLASLGFVGQASLFDIWNQTSEGTVSSAGTYTVTLNSHATQLLKVTPQLAAYQYLANSPVNTVAGGAVISPQIPTATNGYKVGYIGEGGTIQFNDVSVGQAGTYYLTISYFDGDSGRNMSISANGGTATSYAFPGNSSWYTVLSYTVPIQLQAGSNSITFSNPSGWAPDIDSIAIQRSTAPALGNGPYEIQSTVNSSLGVSVSGSSTSNGAAIIQSTYTGNSDTAAQWVFVPTANGYYEIKNVNSGLAIVTQSASFDPGALLIQFAFGSESENDQWEVAFNSDGTFSFYNRNSEMVLDDTGASSFPGTQYDQWLSNYNPNQRFNLVPVP
jgi:hypothetical protein